MEVKKRAAQSQTVALYFLLAYVFTWLCHLAIPVLHLKFSVETFSLSSGLYLLGLGGPLFSAIALSVREGRGSVRSLFGQALRWRFSATLYLVAFGAVATVYAITDLIFVLRGGHEQGPWIDATGVLPLLAIQIWVVVGEEFGWRGFALPRLQSLIGPLPAALLVGVLWAAWHLPMFFVPGSPQRGGSFIQYCYVLTAWSIAMTVLYNHAGGSVIVTMLFHASANGWAFVFNVPAAMRGVELGLYAVLIVVAIVTMRRAFQPIPLTGMRTAIDNRS